ncbi:hypothetical protein [uncultured Xylophilus sp.]|uniref:hypothetical protein n=1 Tax=uncultured Xylophilus sp. TaxID=296832 RepID=UPI0025D31DD8|nr:hypothetical protein [uncultured Xylophilus sp.]
MQPRYWHTRLLLALSVLVSIYICWREPDSLGHRIIVRSGSEGWICVAALAAVALAALADIFVNDILPARVTLCAVMSRRHLVYMAMAVGLMSLCYVVADEEGWTELLLHYGLLAAFSAHIAFTDLFHRHRGACA